MRIRISFLFLFLAFFLLSGLIAQGETRRLAAVDQALARLTVGNTETSTVPGEFLVKFASKTLEQINGVKFRPISRNIAVAAFEELSVNLGFARFWLEEHDLAVVSIEPNFVGRAPLGFRSPLTGETETPSAEASLAASLPSHLSALEVADLPRTCTPTNAVIIDSGIDPAMISKDNSVDWQQSRNMYLNPFVSSALKDIIGHGRFVGAIVSSIADCGVKFLSLQIFQGRYFRLANGQVVVINYYTAEGILRAFQFVADSGISGVVNGSFSGIWYPGLVKEILKTTQDRLLWVFSAGNIPAGSFTKAFLEEISAVEAPAKFARELPNVISVASVELDGRLSSFSKSGILTEIAAFGNYGPSLYGTSFSAPEVTGLALRLRQALFNATPALLKKLLLSASYNGRLAGLIGDLDLGTDGLQANGRASLQAVQRLQKMEATNTSVVGDQATLTVTEDLAWLFRFDKAAWYGSSFMVEMAGTGGRIITAPVSVNKNGVLFSAPLPGVYAVRLLTDHVFATNPVAFVVPAGGSE